MVTQSDYYDDCIVTSVYWLYSDFLSDCAVTV
jgi:hypothetical protein